MHSLSCIPAAGQTFEYIDQENDQNNEAEDWSGLGRSLDLSCHTLVVRGQYHYSFLKLSYVFQAM